MLILPALSHKKEFLTSMTRWVDVIYVKISGIKTKFYGGCGTKTTIIGLGGALARICPTD